MPAAPILMAGAAVVGAGAAVVGTINANKAQKRQARAQEQQQQVSTRHQRRQGIREAQLARAQSVATASAQGATGSSAALHGVGSIGSQLGSGLGFSTQMSGISSEINSAARAAQRGAQLASIGGTLFNFGMSQGGGDYLRGMVTPNRPPSGFSPTHSGYTS